MKNFLNQRLFLIKNFTKNSIINNEKLSRNLTILPYHLDKVFLIHNGKSFTKVIILKEMIGFKLGEFVKTRKTFKFKKK